MLDQDQISRIAQRLDEAERTRVQIGHVSAEFPGMTIGDGYAVQRAWVDRKIAAGRVVKGHKIGLTSRAMQQSSQIDEPDYGVLLDDMFFADGSDIPYERFIEPRVEVELAFILAKQLKAGCTMEDVLDATEYVTPAVEIIDARILRQDPATKAMRKVMDTISDNAANAGIVLGGKRIRPRDVDLRWVSALCRQNGVVEETGVAAGVLDHPANGVMWLANKLAPHGATLEPGHVVLAGSFTRPVFANKGDSFQVDYGSLGVIAFRFV